MPFYRGGAKKRRDAIEPSIILALKQRGAQVWQISGRGNPDLLVKFRGQYFPLEVKSATGALTDAQTDIPWPVVRTPDDALIAIGFDVVEVRG